MTGDGDLGVQVNGLPALVNGGLWAVEVPVTPGSNLLTAVAWNDAGATASASISVNLPETPSVPLVLTANPASGVAPLTITWQVGNQSGRPFVQCELDLTGGGTFGTPAATFDGTQSTYDTPGLFHPVLRATDDQGAIYTATTVVNVLPQNQLDAALQTKGAAMKAALGQQDVEGALAFFVPAERERFWTILSPLRNDLPQLVQDLGNIQLISLVDNRAKYRLRRTELYGGQSVTFTYYVYFIRDLSGAWRIEGF